jgi:hypothetical protein
MIHAHNATHNLSLATKLAMTVMSAGAFVALGVLDANSTTAHSAVQQPAQAASMQTGETSAPTTAHSEPPTAKAVPGIRGPAPMPSEQQSARD